MVRKAQRHGGRLLCSPHPRGDGPCFGSTPSPMRLFSPPAWGWSAEILPSIEASKVLPTRVGMVRVDPSIPFCGRRSPHPRGDGPVRVALPFKLEAFSPPAWGWSGFTHAPPSSPAVLPTRVGMVRRSKARPLGWRSSPHPRGDGPGLGGSQSCGGLFSPPAWGWSGNERPAMAQGGVLPTRVGMVRVSTWALTQANCSPHPRGDGPQVGTTTRLAATFSPPAWGWSGLVSGIRSIACVLPTRVGMVRISAGHHPAKLRSPHPRGDGPLSTKPKPAATSFSPPAWGWSG